MTRLYWIIEDDSQEIGLDFVVNGSKCIRDILEYDDIELGDIGYKYIVLRYNGLGIEIELRYAEWIYEYDSGVMDIYCISGEEFMELIKRMD
ncbi:MAG: hypothetical protein ACRDD8_06885 [Bacteroidales bacterium]